MKKLPMPCHEKTAFCIYANTKVKIRCTVIIQLISAFVFASNIDCTIPLHSRSEISSSTSSSVTTAWFVSDLFRNPKERFSCDIAHM